MQVVGDMKSDAENVSVECNTMECIVCDYVYKYSVCVSCTIEYVFRDHTYVIYAFKKVINYVTANYWLYEN